MLIYVSPSPSNNTIFDSERHIFSFSFRPIRHQVLAGETESSIVQLKVRGKINSNNNKETIRAIIFKLLY